MATATFKAMVSSRKTALYMLGRLRKIMPAAVADTVQRIAIEPGASIIRDTVELSNDQEAGGLYRVWLIEQPLMIQFSNDDEDISYEGN